jgi:hypothetical protein
VRYGGMDITVHQSDQRRSPWAGSRESPQIRSSEFLTPDWA